MIPQSQAVLDCVFARWIRVTLNDQGEPLVVSPRFDETVIPHGQSLGLDRHVFEWDRDGDSLEVRIRSVRGAYPEVRNLVEPRTITELFDLFEMSVVSFAIYVMTHSLSTPHLSPRSSLLPWAVSNPLPMKSYLSSSSRENRGGSSGSTSSGSPPLAVSSP